MSVVDKITAERRELNNQLLGTIDNCEKMGEIAVALVKTLHQSQADPDIKKGCLRVVRSWASYSDVNSISPDNSYAMRYHIEQFAAEEFGEQTGCDSLLEIDLSQTESCWATYQDLLSEYVSPEIFSDPDVALFGGAARIALKLLAGVNTDSELPVNDIDTIITSNANVAEKAQNYGVDLGGAKIVSGDILPKVAGMITNFDCTMNQVAVYNGKLYCTESAMKDVAEGNIRIIANNDPLFGSEGELLPDGNTYINRRGFYRGLSFLLRNKGDQLIVSQENIDREFESIGRYWLVMLFVKLIPLKDQQARYQAIGNWHEIASRYGATQTSDPQAFFVELMEKYPEMRLNTKEEFNTEKQARWIVGKLVSTTVHNQYQTTKFEPPANYTPANITLADSFMDYDYESFINSLDIARKK